MTIHDGRGADVLRRPDRCLLVIGNKLIRFMIGTVYIDDEVKPSEGHGHAHRHFRETGFPLIVNVHSITPFGAKCYNFAQDRDHKSI